MGWLTNLFERFTHPPQDRRGVVRLTPEEFARERRADDMTIRVAQLQEGVKVIQRAYGKPDGSKNPR